ncbi:HEL081Cp [Eremothecium sinecaudum]|uniref:HEL081Cp n=1 Tax=Eremothecium sinecaudum TaxID=45286 RepID=A0A0X8HTJ7_9SACH|nr:HEL081Cp [Eremothecium sinecaudum]AMD21199.1 HEL081Cp [Eremothecium sinecaudum]
MQLFYWSFCCLVLFPLSWCISLHISDQNSISVNAAISTSLERNTLQPLGSSSSLIPTSEPSLACQRRIDPRSDDAQIMEVPLFEERYTEHNNELKIKYKTDYPFAGKVDVFYGTEGGGRMFPGTTLPFSMCKMGVDVISAKADVYSGYLTNGEVVGISLLHQSGGRGVPNYGIVSQLPMMVKDIGDVDISKQISFKRRGTDSGHIGYYKTRLDNGAIVEFSSGERSGLYQYRFPSLPSAHPVVMVNVTHHLHSYLRPWKSQNFVKGYIQVNKDMQSYSGKAIMSGGWSNPASWVVSFYGIFDKPANAVRAFQGNSFVNGYRVNFVNDHNKSFGLFFEFDESVKLLKCHVGVSFAKDSGIEAAKMNIAKDYPESHNFDLDWSVNNALKRWNDEVFEKIDIITENEDPVIVEKLLTAIYGAHIMPISKTGSEAPWRTDEPYYDDWPSLWNTFRCLHPLFNFFNQDRSTEMVRSLIEVWRHEGYLPDGRSAGRSAKWHGPSNAGIVLADAFVKNITEGINWKEGYKAMKRNAERGPKRAYDSTIAAGSGKSRHINGALTDWLRNGYVTTKYSKSVSKTMEFAYNAFALYQVAKGLGKKSDAQRYLRRSSNWQNLWNYDAFSPKYNVSGFLQPREENGVFAEQHVSYVKYPDYSSEEIGYTPAPDEYGWTVPYDMATLKEFVGSEEEFEKRLDSMFAMEENKEADISNSINFLTPYLYNFINRQDKTSEVVNQLLETRFKTGPKGLPGNSNAGSLQAWVFFALIGFYPIAGTDIYLISGPKLSYLKLRNLPNLGPVEIIANNLYNEGKKTPEYRNKYIASVTINGYKLTRNWLFHEEIFGQYGSKIEFEMSDVPIQWDSSGYLPPSLGHYNRQQELYQ